MTDGLREIRQSVGGAGFTKWSGIPKIIENDAPRVTFEGDNTMMLGQASNFLFKQAKKGRQGKNVHFAYLIEKIHPQTKFPDLRTLEGVGSCLKVSVLHRLEFLLHKLKDEPKMTKKNF